ncbi:MAG: hypothetical protein JXQ87_13500 [Bacteroidia bacterium]
MRTELEQIKKIELYLNNKLNSKDKQAFEQKLAVDKELQQKVEFQKQFIKRLKRSAMLVALENEHLSLISGGGTGATKGIKTTSSGLKLQILNNLNSIIVATLGVIGLSVAIYFVTNKKSSIVIKNTENQFKTKKHATIAQLSSNGYWHYHNYVTQTLDNYSNDKVMEKLGENLKVDSIKNKVKVPVVNKESDSIVQQIRFKPPTGYIIDPTISNTIIDTISNSKIVIPPNAFRYKFRNRPLVTENVRIIYKEYRSIGDMATSAIPMHWFGKDSIPFRFHSEGMFSILATTDSGSVTLTKPIRVTFTPIQLTDSLNLFYLSDTNSRWQFVQQIVLPKMPIDSNQFNAFEEFRQKAGETGFGDDEENKPNWAKPKFDNNGNAYRYGFWGRLLEFITKGTVYGQDSASFKRVFTEDKKLVLSESNAVEGQISNDNLTTKTEHEAQSITVKRLGYYNYGKLQKNQDAIRPIIRPLNVKNEYLKRVYKIVAVEQGLNAAYHFYDPKLCLNPNRPYDFFAFTFDGRILYASRNKYKVAKSSTELVLRFVDVTNLVSSASDFDMLLGTAGIISSKSIL